MRTYVPINTYICIAYNSVAIFHIFICRQYTNLLLWRSKRAIFFVQFVFIASKKKKISKMYLNCTCLAVFVLLYDILYFCCVLHTKINVWIFLSVFEWCMSGCIACTLLVWLYVRMDMNIFSLECAFSHCVLIMRPKLVDVTPMICVIQSFPQRCVLFCFFCVSSLPPLRSIAIVAVVLSVFFFLLLYWVFFLFSRFSTCSTIRQSTYESSSNKKINNTQTIFNIMESVTIYTLFFSSYSRVSENQRILVLQWDSHNRKKVTCTNWYVAYTIESTSVCEGAR